MSEPISKFRLHLHKALDYHLQGVESTLREFGVANLSKLTLIVRDPNNDHAKVVLSNDDLAEAFRVAGITEGVSIVTPEDHAKASAVDASR